MKRILINITGHLAHTALALLWLQCLSLIAIIALQYGAFNHLPAEKANGSEAVSLYSILGNYTVPAYDLKPEDPNLLVTIGLWFALLLILVLLSIYLTKVSSAIVHRLANRLYDRATSENLLTIKLASASIAFFVIAGSALILPAVTHIMLLNTTLVLVCCAGFTIQHQLQPRKTLAKNLL